jgi:hypothetical protein
MARELEQMTDQTPGGRMRGRTIASETSDERWIQRRIYGLRNWWVERWSDFRDLLHGLRVAWVSTASALIGLLLYLKAPQAQDLFLEVKGHWLSDALFWIAFYLVVVLAWALPVFVSARWILARFEEGPHEHPHVPPVKTWVRRRLPRWLGAACIVAVFVGQLMATSNVPTTQNPWSWVPLQPFDDLREYFTHLALYHFGRRHVLARVRAAIGIVEPADDTPLCEVGVSDAGELHLPRLDLLDLTDILGNWRPGE